MESIRWLWAFLLSFLSLGMAVNLTARGNLRCIMYFTGYVSKFPSPLPMSHEPMRLTPCFGHSQHPIAPPISQLQHVTHVAVAFMSPGVFNEPGRTDWPLFTTIDEVRAKFPKETKIQVAIGGWGDTIGFSVAALNDETRKTFAENVANMVVATGADGVDIDWEYPG